MDPHPISQLYALDYGVVFVHQNGAWVEDPSADVDPAWIEELRVAGLTPLTTPTSIAAPTAGSKLRVVPLGLHPAIKWSEAKPDVLQSPAPGDEGILPVMPGDPTAMGPGAEPGGLPPFVGKVVKWAGLNLVWDGVKWVVGSALA